MNTARNADPAELAKFDALAHGFWDPQGPLRTLHALNPVRVDFIAARSPLKDKRIADVGCGGGILAESLAARGARVTAIDLAPAMIEVAQLHAHESGASIDYRHCDAAALAAAEPASFDVVTCMELIEHVPDPAALVATLAQLLRPGGALYISTINRSPKSFALAIVAAEYVLGLVPRGTHEYARLVRPAELAAMARSAGLSLADIAGLHFNPLSGRCTLDENPDVNYLAQFHAAASS
ncbi:MAG: bifunctional 2-polyprenyl-6-hydroxyphenol methylase/3-demethylubiquinol 3-O-methyltransferase UbiG [Steroidobacteraceae bacterium]